MKDKIFYICLGVFIIVWFTLFSTVEVDGTSMYPTFKDNDFCLVFKHGDVKRGDIVAIYSEALQKVIYKRIIGVSGDTVDIIEGSVILNGENLKEDYIVDEWFGSIKDEVVVPDGMVFVMGDNRENSADSRHLGCLYEKDIRGIFLLNITEKTRLNKGDLLTGVICVWLVCLCTSIILKNKRGTVEK